MTLDADQCWIRLAAARRGVLGTSHPTRGVDAVPVVFAVIDRTVVIPVDTVKAKRSGRLQRLANIRHDARCVLLVDHYEEDWSHLWWVRVSAEASLSPPTDAAVASLAERYPQYLSPASVTGTITLRPTLLSGWANRQ